MAAITNDYIRYIEAREDEIARFVTSIEFMDYMRLVADTLHRRQYITTPYHQELCDILSYSRETLVIGKQNTATLRNGRRQELDR